MRHLGLAFALTVAPVWAAAQDYPFEGIYTLNVADDWTCAFEFMVDTPDGGYVIYALDRDTFSKDGTLSYLMVDQGKCYIESRTATSLYESCGDHSFVKDEGPQNGIYYDSVDFSKADRLTITSFDDKAEQDKFIAGKIKATKTPPFDTARCTMLSMDKLKPFLSTKGTAIEALFYDKYLASVSDDTMAGGFEDQSDDIFKMLK